MKRVAYHIIIPAIMLIVFFMIATTPVGVLGCRTRGLMALMTALISGLAALTTTIMAAKRRSRGDIYSIWWLISSVILVMPVIALIILA